MTYGSETEIRVLKSKNKEKGMDLDQIKLQLAPSVGHNVNIHFPIRYPIPAPSSEIAEFSLLAPNSDFE
jgi:hypothetical protein